jgi:hypothetical protein
MNLYIDVAYFTPRNEGIGQAATGTFGPFASRELAERALIALAGRPGVRQANIRNPEGAS